VGQDCRASQEEEARLCYRHRCSRRVRFYRLSVGSI
jgi:hypothetical protein